MVRPSPFQGENDEFDSLSCLHIMAYKNKQKQLEYQVQWMKNRRDSWLSENGPCKNCGSEDNLEVDHINPIEKIDHKVWSWSEIRRREELAKCQVLCKKCHKEKTRNTFLENRIHGLSNTYKNGCRCNSCTIAQKLNQRNYRSKNI